jgi:hypothetical protein
MDKSAESSKPGKASLRVLLQSSFFYFFLNYKKLEFSLTIYFQLFGFNLDLTTFAMNSPKGTEYRATVPLNKAVAGR